MSVARLVTLLQADQIDILELYSLYYAVYCGILIRNNCGCLDLSKDALISPLVDDIDSEWYEYAC